MDSMFIIMPQTFATPCQTDIFPTPPSPQTHKPALSPLSLNTLTERKVLTGSDFA